MENKQKHLEFIQNIINRMAHNSFNLKRWTIMVVVALILFIKNTDVDYTLLISFPVVIFWILDGYFLSRERLFRSLYDNVRMLNEKEIDFSMDTRKYTKNTCTGWLHSLFAKTLLIFYLPLVILISLFIHFS